MSKQVLVAMFTAALLAMGGAVWLQQDTPGPDAGPITPTRHPGEPPGQDAGEQVRRPLPSAPPRAAGYFRTRPVGAWSSLPGGRTCARRVHRSSWEPRPENAEPNHTMPRARKVRQALALRPVAVQGALPKRWDSWLRQRVTGHYTGTTDEIIQWGACKWGLSDNLLRAIAARESTWYQYLVYRSGRCVALYGCGDHVTNPSRATRRFCAAISRYGYDYRRDYRPGVCPRTFGLTGVMSWWAPGWGKLRANQNGTFPFNRNSTAFAVDYLASELRGCYEGWQWWLRGTGRGQGRGGYRAGDMWGCVGAWYSGEWRSAASRRYVAGVKADLRRRIWLEKEWQDDRPPCSRRFGCPRGG